MDAYQCIATKLDQREFTSRTVPTEVKLKVLESARLTGSGMNSQHWRFILIQNHSNLRRLAEASTTGTWVENCSFAVIVLTNPKHGFHMIDAGRVAQDMQIAAWNYGVTSCVFTGIREERFRKDFNIPKDLNISIIVGFGYPDRKLSGKKNRKASQRTCLPRNLRKHI
ncbi:MAG: nitroreductase family protein [Thaumarchaeota archaeon]|nr:nitroreductase family protein [Nitrososphaerota archaeon]